MPKRFIHESICSSESLDRISEGAQAFFYRLITKADDYGRYDGRVSMIRSSCYPLCPERYSVKDIGSFLGELVAEDIIRFYSFEGKPYLVFTNFLKYQQVRASVSKWPDPLADDISCAQMISDDITRYQTISHDITRYQMCSYPYANANAYTDTVQADADAAPSPEGPGEVSVPDELSLLPTEPADTLQPYEADFNDAWKHYPKKKDRGAALRAYQARRREKVSRADLLAAVEHYAAACEESGAETRYIKNGSTFFGPDRPYRDYVTKVQAQTPSPSEPVYLDENRFIPESRRAYLKQKEAERIAARDKERGQG